MEFEPGVCIDASHQSADTLNLRIVDLAYSFGWVISAEDKHIVNEFRQADYNEPDSEMLNEIADECVSWLNDKFAEHNFVWHIEDNSLFVSRIEDGE